MAKIPTHQNVHLTDGGQRNVEHVIFESASEDTSFQILFSQIQRFGCHWQHFSAKTKQLGVNVPNWL